MPDLKKGLWALASPGCTLASVASLVLGAAASARGGPMSWPWLFATAAGLFFFEVAKNASGEIPDYDSGADLAVSPADRSPFSGGKRVLVDALMTRAQVWATAAACYGLGIAAGLAIVCLREPRALPLGLAGAALAWSYHGRPLRLSYRGLGEAAVATAYGPLICCGTYLVQRGELPLWVLALSLPLGVLIAAFLWINQFPDYLADRAAGKRNLVVRLGRPAAARVFALLVGLGFGLQALLPALGAPAGALLGLLGLPFGAAAARRLLAHPEETSFVLPAQAWTLLSFLLLSLGASAGLLLRG